MHTAFVVDPSKCVLGVRIQLFSGLRHSYAVKGVLILWIVHPIENHR